MAEKAIRDNLAPLKDEVHYEEYKDIYENAINEFINNTLSDANYSDFETVKSIGMEEFKKTDAYKNIELTVQVKAVFNGDNFKSAIKNNLTESVANRISGLMLGEIPAYDEIINRAVEKALNGDFDVNGAFNEDKLIEWAIGEIKASLVDFYPNGLGDMSIEELNMMYDTLTEAAREQNDVAKFKEAALMYCNALKKKNIPALNQAIEEIFGSNYADTINKLTSSEIDAKMEDLKTQALQFAEVSSLSDSDKDSFFAGVKD